MQIHNYYLYICLCENTFVLYSCLLSVCCFKHALHLIYWFALFIFTRLRFLANLQRKTEHNTAFIIHGLRRWSFTCWRGLTAIYIQVHLTSHIKESLIKQKCENTRKKINETQIYCMDVKQNTEQGICPQHPSLSVNVCDSQSWQSVWM